MGTFFRDLRYAGRLLVGQPGFTIAAIVSLYTTREGQTLYAWFSYPDYRDLRDQNDVFAGVAGHAPNRFAATVVKTRACRASS